ncbi:MAG: hypothetical protein ACKO9Q_07090, partial [Pirellula sp.]
QPPLGTLGSTCHLTPTWNLRRIDQLNHHQVETLVALVIRIPLIVGTQGLLASTINTLGSARNQECDLSLLICYGPKNELDSSQPA